jgi:hypothetical protein
MPRKQRFKPSRKPQQQPKIEKQQEEHEIHPDEVSVENEVPARGRPDDSDVEGSR